MARWTPERIDQAHNTVAAHVVDSIEALEALNELNRTLEDQMAEIERLQAERDTILNAIRTRPDRIDEFLAWYDEQKQEADDG